jgi:nitric oxide dioxygenase
MLTAETNSTIKSTIPLLQENGLEITTTFYKLLFEANPELHNIFNSANQQDTSQSRALSDAILAYANNIENLEALLPAVGRIANKHASIGIKKEHYPLVGASLIAAIQQVLSLPDEHPALTAWGEAYGVLADVFIQSESALYNDRSSVDGGWEGFRPFVIRDIKQETPEVKSFILEAKDKKAVLKYSGGQYVGVKLTATGSEYEQIRQYSLSDWAENFRLTIKQEMDGQVSQSIHNYAVGDELLMSPPFGGFNLNSDVDKHVFISGGVGITPLFSMLKQAVSSGLGCDQLQFIECCRGAEHQIFKDELRALSNKNFIQLKQAFEYGEGGDFNGRITAEILDKWLTDKSANVYFCGPLPFMSQMKKLLNEIGFGDGQLHYEVFGPTTEL